MAGVDDGSGFLIVDDDDDDEVVVHLETLTVQTGNRLVRRLNQCTNLKQLKFLGTRKRMRTTPPPEQVELCGAITRAAFNRNENFDIVILPVLPANALGAVLDAIVHCGKAVRCLDLSYNDVNYTLLNQGSRLKQILSSCDVQKLSLNKPHLGVKLLNLVSSLLAHNTTVTCLNLEEAEFTARSFQTFIGFLKTNTTLTDLNLADNTNSEMGADCVEHLPEIFRDHNTSLTSLNLKRLVLQGPALFFHHMSDTVRVATSLTRLVLDTNNRFPEGGTYLTDFTTAVRTNSTLTDLSLDFNNMGYQMESVYTLLQSTSLDRLSLVGNDITQPLSQHIARNSVLSSLNLCKNNLNPQVFVNGLLQNVSLREVEFSSIDLTMNCDCFVDVLRHNTSITYLNLRQSVFDDMHAFAMAVQESTTLRSLTLGLGDRELISFVTALKKNKHLQKLDISHSWVTDLGLARLLDCIKNENTTLMEVIATRDHPSDRYKAIVMEMDYFLKIRRHNSMYDVDTSGIKNAGFPGRGVKRTFPFGSLNLLLC